MLSISTLKINNIDCNINAMYLATVFEKQKLANISRVILIPYINHNGLLLNMAIMEVDNWFDNISSINFRIKLYYNGEGKVVHNDPDTWYVEMGPEYCEELYSNEFVTTIIEQPEWLNSTTDMLEMGGMGGMFELTNLLTEDVSDCLIQIDEFDGDYQLKNTNCATYDNICCCVDETRDGMWCNMV